MKNDRIFNSIKFLGGANKFKDLPTSNLPEITFWGRSNVGKSSTINSIFENKTVARVSRTPGRTQQINLFLICDNIATIADLPGYGYAKVSKTTADNLYQLCYDYLHNRKTTQVFLLIDARRGIMDIDFDVIKAMEVLGHQICLLFTKADLVDKQNLKDIEEKALGLDFLMISNKSRAGIIDLRKKITSVINRNGRKNKNNKAV